MVEIGIYLSNKMCFFVLYFEGQACRYKPTERDQLGTQSTYTK